MMMQNMQNMMMQNMMQNMNGWGWGGKQEQQGGNMQQGGNWWGMQSQEDYEAYMKWCEENKMRQQEQEKQRELIEMWHKQEEHRKMEAEKEKQMREASERQENMMSQWKMWEKRLEMQHEFDDLAYAVMEMKHKYMYTVTMEFLKFCQCSDFTADLERFFMHDGVSYQGEDWELDDLNGIDTDDPVAVARVLVNVPKVDQIKAFFGGLATSMCLGGRGYVQQLMQWQKDTKFLDRLM